METNKQTLPHGYVLQGEKNRYVIDRVLGQGSFGITYLATFKSRLEGTMGSGTIQSMVAIKEFFMKDMNTRDGSSGYLNDSSQDSLIGRYRRAFMREARNLSGLHHENIVKVFEVIEANNTVYLVMEYINGGSLDEYIAAKGHLSEQEAIEKMLKLCSAVGCMHEHRMLHLDIKPKNVMLDEDDKLYLIDFGLSKQYNADGEPESSTSIGLGTPGYAPVEQAEHQDGGKKFLATIDIYALGATLYKMLTGNMPPKASQVSDSALDGDNIILKKLKESGVSTSLLDVVTKAMWPSSSKRYQSVKEFTGALINVPSPDYATLKDGEETVANIDSTHHNCTKAKSHSKGVLNSKCKPVPKSTVDTKYGFPSWLYVPLGVLVGLILYYAIPKQEYNDSLIDKPNKTDRENVELSSTTGLQSNTITNDVTSEEEINNNETKELVLDYGVWNGKTLNGKPDGEGIIRFTKSFVYYDTEVVTGYTMNATFSKGALVVGKIMNRKGELYRTIMP